MPGTYQSETGTIEQMVVKPPGTAFLHQDKLNREWEKLNYLAAPDFSKAIREFDQLREQFQSWDIDLHFLPEEATLSIDSIYCRDASVISDAGAIICQMGKASRAGEPEALEQFYKSMNIPVLGRISGEGKLEGGDTAWLDENTLAVGRGYRSNAEGIRQLRELAEGHFEVLEVPLPHYKGPADVFHLMSIISPIDEDLALVYSPLMVVTFREWLLDRGIRLVEVPDEEFESMGGNVLAVAPRKCIMLSGNPLTKARLEAEGVEVHTYAGTEISAKGCGGPTCLTRPLLRRK